MNITKYLDRHRILPVLLCLGMAVNVAPALAAAPVSAVAADVIPVEQIFATVNGKVIPIRQYMQLRMETMRARYYHGKIPEGEEELVRKEVADRLIERMLTVEEAEKRGIKPDEAAIEQLLASADKRYANKAEFKAEREQLLSELRGVGTRQSLSGQLEDQVRNAVPEATQAEVQAYYERKPELFTEPEKLHLSIILLKVDPSAPQEEWSKVVAEARVIHQRIKNGSDFAKEARLHSGDDSAEDGGDMGYMHAGILPQDLVEVISKFQVGVVNEPIRQLQGIAIYRVEDRVLAKLQEFSKVESRARALLRRERQDQTWKDYVSSLRNAAKIEILAPGFKKD